VTIDKSHIQPINTRFSIDILDEQTYRLTASEDEASYYNYIDNAIVSNENRVRIDTICRFNETVSSHNFKFSIGFHKEYYSPELASENEYYFEFYHLDELTKSYLKRLKVEPVSIRSSLINLLFQGETDALQLISVNKFIQSYLDENLRQKE